LGGLSLPAPWHSFPVHMSMDCVLTCHLTVVFELQVGSYHASSFFDNPECSQSLESFRGSLRDNSGQRIHPVQLVGSFVNYWDVRTWNIYLYLNPKMYFSPTHASVCFLKPNCCQESCKAVCLVPTAAFGSLYLWEECGDYRSLMRSGGGFCSIKTRHVSVL
jgi:hypothetical protein